MCREQQVDRAVQRPFVAVPLQSAQDARIGVNEKIAGLWVYLEELFFDSKRDLQVIASMTGGTASTANTAPSALTTLTSVPFFNGAPVTFQ